MAESEKILIIGTSVLAEKIEELFARSGIPNARVKHGSDFPFSPDFVIDAADNNTLVLEKPLAPGCIVATTQPAKSANLSASMAHSDKLVALSFNFNPLEPKTLVQIVRGLDTAPETIEKCRALFAKIGLTTAVTVYVPGLIVDRVMASMINEAAIML